MSSLDPDTLASLQAWENRKLTAEEFEARINAPMSTFEREDIEGHYAWFTRRYPTAGERLRAIDHLMRQWLRNRPR